MAPSTRHASTGALLPFASTGGSGLEPRGVADEPLGHRADQDVAAAGRLLEPFRGVDRVAGGERRRIVARHHLAGVDPDADPQLGHPARPSSEAFSRSTAFCMSSAARTARSASSSCARGRPKTAITASPMNFSTVPPWRSTAIRISSYHVPKQLA